VINERTGESGPLGTFQVDNRQTLGTSPWQIRSVCRLSTWKVPNGPLSPVLSFITLSYPVVHSIEESVINERTGESGPLGTFQVDNRQTLLILGEFELVYIKALYGGSEAPPHRRPDSPSFRLYEVETYRQLRRAGMTGYQDGDGEALHFRRRGP
jgi:hypothetical protein